jgi:hypothetical protein
LIFTAFQPYFAWIKYPLWVKGLFDTPHQFYLGTPKFPLQIFLFVNSYAMFTGNGSAQVQSGTDYTVNSLLGFGVYFIILFLSAGLWDAYCRPPE